MGDPRLIPPFTDAVKHKADIIATGTSGLALFKAVPWPEVAGALAAIYWLIRIAAAAVSWFRKGPEA